MTEIVFALGLGASLVGRSRFCDYPPEAMTVAEIGGFSDPSVEKILSLRPTLVCGERGPAGPDLVARLEKLGLSTFFPAMDDVASIGAAMADLGERLGVRAAGERLRADLAAAIEDVKRRVAGKARPRVLLVFDWQPLVAAGPGGFPDELLGIAGADNVVREGGKYPRLGVEGVFALDPDVVLDGSTMGDASTKKVGDIAALASLRAIQKKRLHALDTTAALRPGPRLGAGLAEITRLVHEQGAG
mgnify:CR=1 FL=1